MRGWRSWVRIGFWVLLYAVVAAIGLAEVYSRRASAVFAQPVTKYVVVLDAGHGGWDPWG